MKLAPDTLQRPLQEAPGLNCNQMNISRLITDQIDNK